MALAWTLVVVAAVVAVSGPAPVTGKKVLLLPYPFTSHARQLLFVGEGLVEQGHEVFIVLTDSFPGLHLFRNSKVKLLTHTATLTDFYQMPEENAVFSTDMIISMRNTVSLWRQNMPMWENVIKNQLIDDAHYEKLKRMKFDFAIVDLFPMSRALLVIPYSLGIPYIGLETMQEPWLTRNPSLPSFVPSNMFIGEYTPRMNFWQRLNNLWMTIDWNAWPGITYLKDEYIRKYIRDDCPVKTMNELVGKCLLVLIDCDPVLDYARPLMPNEVLIGGLTIGSVKELPEDLAAFMDSSKDGVILMAFGSLGIEYEEALINQFVLAFSKIPYNIVWKYEKKPLGLTANVKVAKWLPQHDLLAHRNMKIFITHCGNNGQMESLSNSIPMIGIPFFGDQMYNCERLIYHGYGVCLDPLNFKASHLVDAVNSIMSNSSYKKNIAKAAAIFKDPLISTRKRALYWVEHVMKYGGDHLRSHALDMPWYEFLMLDIAVFLLLLSFSAAAICLALLYMICQFLGNRKPHQKHE